MIFFARKTLLHVGTLLLLMVAIFCPICSADDVWIPPKPVLADKYKSLDGAPAFRGKDGWYFLAKELRFYSVGPFWGEFAERTAIASKDKDPLAAILHFNELLKKQDIHLILVPVPGKVRVYPDKIVEEEPRAVWDIREFYDLLRNDGIDVIDLRSNFFEMRKAGTDTHCQQDSHWSPQAVKLAAGKIANAVRRQAWYKDAPKLDSEIRLKEVQVRGDLADMLKDATAPLETLTVEEVLLDGQYVESDRDSPVVLMGDSHTLVYHSRLLADHAGLPDHLAAELGMRPDILGMRGGGANASRIALARRGDNMAGKRCVIWCFAIREFTEAEQGWKIIPVIR